MPVFTTRASLQPPISGLAKLPNELLYHLFTMPGPSIPRDDHFVTDPIFDFALSSASVLKLLQAARPPQAQPMQAGNLLHRLMDHAAAFRPEVISAQTSYSIAQTIRSPHPISQQHALQTPPWFGHVRNLDLDLPNTASHESVDKIQRLLRALDATMVQSVRLTNPDLANLFVFPVLHTLLGWHALTTLDIHANHYPLLDVFTLAPRLQHATIRFDDRGPSDAQLDPALIGYAVPFFAANQQQWKNKSISLMIAQPRAWHDDVIEILMLCPKPVVHTITAFSCIDTPTWNDALLTLTQLPSLALLDRIQLVDSDYKADNLLPEETALMVENIEHHKQIREMVLDHTYVLAEHFSAMAKSLVLNTGLHAVTISMLKTSSALPVSLEHIVGVIDALLKENISRAFTLYINIYDEDRSERLGSDIEVLNKQIAAAMTTRRAKNLVIEVMDVSDA